MSHPTFSAEFFDYYIDNSSDSTKVLCGNGARKSSPHYPKKGTIPETFRLQIMLGIPQSVYSSVSGKTAVSNGIQNRGFERFLI